MNTPKQKQRTLPIRLKIGLEIEATPVKTSSPVLAEAGGAMVVEGKATPPGPMTTVSPEIVRVSVGAPLPMA